MLATFILRLVPAALQQGALVGRIECVETGEGQTCRHVDELVAFVRAQAGFDQIVVDGEDQ